MSPQEYASEPRHFRFERFDVVTEWAFLGSSGRHNEIHADWKLCVQLAKRFSCQTLDAIALNCATHAGSDRESKPCVCAAVQVRMQHDPA